MTLIQTNIVHFGPHMVKVGSGTVLRHSTQGQEMPTLDTIKLQFRQTPKCDWQSCQLHYVW